MIFTWQFDGALLPACALLFTAEKLSGFISVREKLKFPDTLSPLAQRHSGSTRGLSVLAVLSFRSHVMLPSNHSSQMVASRPWRESGERWEWHPTGDGQSLHNEAESERT